MPSNVPLTRPLLVGLADRRRSDTVGEAFDRFPMVVVERRHEGVDLLVGGRRQCAVEQTQRLQAGLHRVHGPQRYRRTRRPGSRFVSMMTPWKFPTTLPASFHKGVSSTTWQPSPTSRLWPEWASGPCRASSTAVIRSARRRAPRCTRRWRSSTTARPARRREARPSARASSACWCRSSTSRPRTSACAASCSRCSRTASRSCSTTSTHPIGPAGDWWKFHGTSSTA